MHKIWSLGSAMLVAGTRPRTASQLRTLAQWTGRSCSSVRAKRMNFEAARGSKKGFGTNGGSFEPLIARLEKENPVLFEAMVRTLAKVAQKGNEI